MPQVIHDKNFLIAFGKRLKALRMQKGLSQYKLSYLSDIPRSTIQKLETGDINSSLSVIPFLAKALEVQPKDLMEF